MLAAPGSSAARSQQAEPAGALRRDGLLAALPKERPSVLRWDYQLDDLERVVELG